MVDPTNKDSIEYIDNKLQKIIEKIEVKNIFLIANINFVDYKSERLITAQNKFYVHKS